MDAYGADSVVDVHGVGYADFLEARSRHAVDRDVEERFDILLVGKRFGDTFDVGKNSVRRALCRLDVQV